MPPYVARLVGDPRFPRYVIRDKSRPGEWFFTGRAWNRLQKARLFAEIDDVNRVIAQLYAEMLR